MRYDRLRDIIVLAYWMASTRTGVSLNEIQERFDVSRRTAERMRDAVADIYHSFEPAPTDDREKRWRISSLPPNNPIPVSFDELRSLQRSIDLLEEKGLRSDADAILSVLTKVSSGLPANLQVRWETDLDALSSSERFLTRVGPVVRSDPRIVAAIRMAILKCQEIAVRYQPRWSDDELTLKMKPYGLVFGNRHYIVGTTSDFPSLPSDFRLFDVTRIEEITETGRSFEYHPEFSLRKFADRAFGVFQEEPRKIVWRFRPEAAEDARDFLFHSSQTIEEEDDGSLLVCFEAGGLKEMCWHLFQWGDAVEVLEPQELKRTADSFRAVSQRVWEDL